METGNDDRSKILIIDADDQRSAQLCQRLSFLDYDPVIDPDSLRGAASDSVAVVVGSSISGSAADKLQKIRSFAPELPFLCLPECETPASGPNWRLDLPLKRAQLTRLLARAKRYKGCERRHRITGTSHPVRLVRRLIEQVADFETNVLITGESGTGKELVARTIHELSDRSDKAFVPINCGAIPADLLESELFGHVKGAFTGAVATREGRFELAEGGTLFLDEIGEMSMDMQVKLLRVLQERCFERVGSNSMQDANVRIIAATHVDLPEAVAKGEFREDLFYRLNVFPIEMPPLYKRATDLPQLLDELLIAHSDDGTAALRVSPDAIRVLARYRWPGNIRELSNLVERLAILKPEGTIEVDDLPAKYSCGAHSPDEVSTKVSQALQMSEENLKEHLAALEQDLISQAMNASDGVVAKAARLLSMQRTTLVEKIGKYDIAS
jgi:sigma-54 specific flagellar transcriptional regulator A